MKLFRRGQPEPIPDRRLAENAELRKQLDQGQKQDTQVRLAYTQFRIDRNAKRIERLEKLVEVLTIRRAREGGG